MFELTDDTASLDQITEYALILSHCFQKLVVKNQRWHHAAAFTATVEDVRRSGYLNAKNELTVNGKYFAAMQRLSLSKAA